jgi:predicted nucleotidyltransferase
VNGSEQWLRNPELRLRALLLKLTQGGVDFVVIGGVAVILQGSPRFTKDLDICYALEQDNLDRLGDVLIELQAKLRTVDEDVPFVPDGRTLRQTQILTLTTDDGQIDLLASPDGAPGYPDLRAKANAIDIEGVTVRIASIDDLLAMKRAAKRPADLIDIESLEAARRRTATSDQNP